ncbi:Hypothetical protein A7982_10097 [Minicystis rosea]|nr:Hypothetical protein A7982_10097 [Minicystis rosea]
MSRAKAVLVALVVAGLDLVAVGAWWRVRELRREIVAAADAPKDFSVPFAPAVHRLLDAEATTLALSGVALLLLVFPVIRAGIAWTRRRNDGGLARSAMVAPALMAALAGAALVCGAYAFHAYREGTLCFPEHIDERRYEAFTAHGRY